MTFDECKTKLRRVAVLQTNKDNLKSQTAVINEELRNLNYAILDFFENNELQNLNLQDVGTAYLVNKTGVKVVDEQKVMAWLSERDDLDMMLTFNVNKLRAYYKSLMEENAELPPGVSLYIEPSIAIRRTK